MQKLTIGQMARINGVSEKTLRMYHDLGLLVPAEVNPETGYRYYDIAQSSRLDLIQTLKELGLSLRQIRTLQERTDLRYFRESLVRQARCIREQQRALALAMYTAERLIDHLDACQENGGESAIKLKHLAARRALCIDPGKVRGGPEAWECCLRRVKADMRKKGIPLILFHGLGRSIPAEALKRQDFDDCQTFVMVDDAFREAPCFVIPEGDYLTIRCFVMLDEKGCLAERSCLLKLLEEADKRNYDIMGRYIGEILVNASAFHDVGREVLMELELPVKMKEQTVI